MKKLMMASMVCGMIGSLCAAEPAYDTLISHRGESIDAPENTLAAYKTAVERGFGFECDIYLSADKRVFTFHDGELTRTTAGACTKKCNEANWETEISKLDVAGWGKWKGSKFSPSRPALLEEVLDLAVDGRKIYVEVKPGPEIVPYVKDIFDKQSKANPGNTLFISFNKGSCKKLKELMPAYKVYWLTGARKKWGKDSEPHTAQWVIEQLRECRADGVDCDFDQDVVTAEFIKTIRDAGFEFHAWTIDRYPTMLKAFKRGAQTVTTNNAKTLLDAYEQTKELTQGKQTEIRPGALWYDTNGHVINAHGCGVMFDKGTYWWYGEHKVYGKPGNKAHVGVHVYSSTDLMNWDDRGIALAVSEAPESDIADGCIIERPKVIRCDKTGKYVMYFHLELKGQGYKAARVGIAVADKPEGPFEFKRSLRPNGEMSRDMTLFIDDDGKAYHIFASENNATTHIDELTDDFLDYTGKSYKMAVKEYTEAQSVCKNNGWYYLVGSGCTGWKPNKARLYRAKSLAGPWENLGNPCRGVRPETGLGPEITWGAQSCYMLPVAGKRGEVIAMFDIWHPANHLESRYVWLPVKFESDRLWIDWQVKWCP